MHLLRPDLHFLSSFVSEYAVGDYSWLMTVGFFFTGNCCIIAVDWVVDEPYCIETK